MKNTSWLAKGWQQLGLRAKTTNWEDVDIEDSSIPDNDETDENNVDRVSYEISVE